VHLKAGVMDPAAASVEASLADMGLPGVSVRTARRYEFSPVPTEPVMAGIIRRVLANDCIETAVVGTGAPPAAKVAPYRFELKRVPVRDLSDAELTDLSARGHLSLNLAEMRAVQEHFRALGREPTDAELETIAQTWSEHCVHKTLKGVIRYREAGREEVIDNLLKTTIAAATHELNRDWCVSVFKDNAGIIRFDDEFNVTFKVETHNRPSAIEPYGGAATGIGGCIRDTMGTGMGAKPVLNTDVFCFAPPDTPLDRLPKGVLPPAKVMRGVVAGVRDYGNRMGIPTANGAVFFDERYLGNPLVYCGSVGLIPHKHSFKQPRAGDRIFVVGGRTGRDGIHGATFSSGELDTKSETIFSHAVQIGNAITEKKLLDGLLTARDRGLYTAVTDCGAGGLSSAVGEMGADLGAEVDLERVPLKYAGLSYTEIWISEAQERMVLAVPPEKADELRAVFAAEGVEATDIGRFGQWAGRTRSGSEARPAPAAAADGDGRPELLLRYEGREVGRLDMHFLHEGVPRFTREAVWEPPARTEPNPAAVAAKIPAPAANPAAPGKAVPAFNEMLRRLLASWNICSKEWVIRQYDHEVQGGSVVKPLVGEHEDGPSDAAVVRPVCGSRKGIAVANGMNPCYGDIDPYWMALAAVDEALRNVTAVGADPDRTAILDNFSWGNCAKPDRLGGLVRAARGCKDAALAYRTPFISGKDSLNNEFSLGDGRSIVIPPSLLISAIGIVDDATRCVTMDAKSAGNLLYVVGRTDDELGGSHFYRLLGEVGANVPRADLTQAPRTLRAMHAAITAGLVRSCHDLSEGGLAVALAETAFAGGFGAAVDLRTVPVGPGVTRAEQILFSESCTRFLVEVEPAQADAFGKALAGVPHACIGRLEHEPWLVVYGLRNETLIEDELAALKEAWQKPLRW
jgi:phosphoribosylformylglycinamidine synthase